MSAPRSPRLQGPRTSSEPIVSEVHGFFAHRTVARWIAYAITFGLLWGLVAYALIFGDSASTAATRGAVGGIVFATLALAREPRGPFRRRRRPCVALRVRRRRRRLSRARHSTPRALSGRSRTEPPVLTRRPTSPARRAPRFLLGRGSRRSAHVLRHMR